MNCNRCTGEIVAETIDAGSYDCCVLSCSECGTIVDKTWNKKTKGDRNAN
jgi:hypothetical protein